MKKFIFILIILLVLEVNLTFAKPGTFENLNVFYSGAGKAEITNVYKDVWEINITGMNVFTNTSSGKNRLTINPQSGQKNNPTAIFINKITTDGSLESLTIKFPPWFNGAGSFLRNLEVNGYVKKIMIQGGDLGSTVDRDGKVYIKDYVNSLIVKGKKYKNKDKNRTEWYGGNIWADIEIGSYAKKIMVQGGNIHLDKNGSTLGSIKLGGDIKQIIAKGVKVKETNTLFKLYGGGIGSYIYSENEIKSILAKGGAYIGGKVNCRQILNLKIIGQKEPGNTNLTFQTYLPEQGIINAQFEIHNYNENSTIKNVSVKNGIIRNSLFSAYEDIKSIKVAGEVDDFFGKGNIENTVIRSGFIGDLSTNLPPEINPSIAITYLPESGSLVIPFSVESENTAEILSARIQYKGEAFSSIISNYSGQVFSGTNVLRGSSPLYGMFVWDSPFKCSNIVIRAYDNGSPNKYSDLNLLIGYATNNAVPEITITPSDNPRYINLLKTNDFSWDVSLYDANIEENLIFAIEDDTLGLSMTPLSARDYTVSAENVTEGTYPDILFKVTDEKGLEASKRITVIVTNIPPLFLHATFNDKTYDNNTFEWLTNTPINFVITAENEELTDITFLPAANMTTGGIYRNVEVAENKFSWTPTIADVGEKTFVFYAVNSDNFTNSVSATIIVTLLPPYVFDVKTSLPVLDFSAWTEDLLSFYVIAEASEKSNLEFLEPPNEPGDGSVYYNSFFLDTKVASNLFSWTPVSPADVGDYTFDFKVVGTFFSKVVTDSVSVTVHIKSRAPVVTTSLPSNDFNWPTNTLLEFFVIAEDDVANELTFDKPLNVPDGSYASAKFNGHQIISNKFSWTPKIADTGSYTFVFIVTDSDGKEGSNIVKFAVVDSPTILSIKRFSKEHQKMFSDRDVNGTQLANIGNISCVGNAYDNLFISSVKKNNTYDDIWTNITYYGRIKQIKIKGTNSTGNVAGSLKKIPIPKKINFDYDINQIWIDGIRETNKF